MSRIKVTQRQCLYELLDIPRDADNDMIKKAFKKQALKWHPDRNIDNQEQATQKFTQINQAYEILSDKHERAWYDANREKIINGITNNDNPNDLDLIPYFSPYAYTSFDDNKSDNFYEIYNELFIKICKLEGLSLKKTPMFGDSKFHYNKIKKFYNYWNNFMSNRNFNHATIYNLNDAQNSKIKKIMIKENKKEKNEQRQKWENTIIKLVSFIKKRDPRFRNYLIEMEKKEKEIEKKEKEYEREIKKIMKEKRKIEKENELKQLNKLLENRPNDYILIDNNIINERECIVCDKIFKTQKSWINHQSSKKHEKELNRVKKELEIENDLLFKKNDIDNINLEKMLEKELDKVTKLDGMIAEQMAQQDILDNIIDNENINNIENNDNDKDTDTDNDSNNNNNNNIKNDNNNESTEDPDYLLAVSLEQCDILDNLDNLATNKKQESVNIENNSDIEPPPTDYEIKALLQSGVDINELIETYPSITQEKISSLLDNNKIINKKNSKKRNKKKKKKKNKNIIQPQLDEINGNNDKTNKINENNEKKEDKNIENNENNDNNDNIVNSIKKKKRRRRKKKDDVIHVNNGNSNKCKGCGQVFDANNQLFKHLKENPSHSYIKNHKY